MPRAALTLWLIAGAATTALYLYGFDLPEERGSLLLTPAWLVQSAGYILAFIGSPIGRLHPWLAMLLGALMLAAFALSALHAARNSERMRPALPVLASLMLFALGCATLAALGRGGESIAQATASRYTTLALPATLALVLLVSTAVPSRKAGPPLPRARWVGAALALLLALHSLHGWYEGMQRGNHYNAAKDALIEGHPEDTMHRLYPQLDKLLERRTWLEENNYSVFR